MMNADSTKNMMTGPIRPTNPDDRPNKVEILRPPRDSRLRPAVEQVSRPDERGAASWPAKPARCRTRPEGSTSQVRLASCLLSRNIVSDFDASPQYVRYVRWPHARRAIAFGVVDLSLRRGLLRIFGLRRALFFQLSFVVPCRKPSR